MKLLALLLFLSVQAAAIPFDFHHIEVERKNGFQRINHFPSLNTSEFLVLTKSHGNAGDVTNRPGVVGGGQWSYVGYAGNDDKSIEVWHRIITRRLPKQGRINIRRGKANLSVFVFSGPVEFGEVGNKKLLSMQYLSIRNPSPDSLYFVVAATDNPATSRLAMLSYGSRDDKTFIYLTADQHFRDPARSRGAMISIEILPKGLSEDRGINMDYL